MVSGRTLAVASPIDVLSRCESSLSNSVSSIVLHWRSRVRLMSVPGRMRSWYACGRFASPVLVGGDWGTRACSLPCGLVEV